MDMDKLEQTQLISEQVSKDLDFVIGTEDQIKCRRAAVQLKTFDDRIKISDIETKVIGSHADGFKFEESDFDTMHVSGVYKVVDGTRTSSHHTNVLHAIFSPCKSGYVHLELNKLGNYSRWKVDDGLIASAICYHKHILASNVLYAMNIGKLGFGGYVRGPSHVNILSGRYDSDTVFGYKCETWPTVANEWIYRNRKYQWPNDNMIRIVCTHGCHLVPVGEYNSPSRDIEWRVSFVTSEVLLVRSFNHVQFKMYGLLKMIKYDILDVYKHTDLQENIITSYHIKTLMFWIIENTPTYLWVDRNFLFCLRFCLVHLRNYLKGLYLPHYFLPRCNLLKKHSARSVRDIVSALDYYIGHIQSLLLNIKRRITCSNVDELLAFSKFESLEAISFIRVCAHINRLLLVFVDNVSKMCDIEYFMLYRVSIFSCWKNTKQDNIKIVSKCKSDYTKHMRYKYISLRGTHLDLTSGWLKLATLYFSVENYDVAEGLCRKVVRSLSYVVIYNGDTTDTQDYLKLVTELRYGRRTLQLDIKQLVAADVVFFPGDIHLDILNIEISSNKEVSTLIPPLPYAYFL